MPPVDLNAFHAAVQTMRDGDVVVLKAAKGQQDPVLKGIKPSKAKKVDGLEMRQAFYSALVKGGGNEACLKRIWQDLGLGDPKIAHKPLTAREIKSSLDMRTESQLSQFEVDNKDPMPRQSSDGFEIIEEPPEKKPGDDFVVVNRVFTQTDFLESTGADKVRDASLQKRRDMLCTHLKAQTAVTDAQLQRLDVEGMKELSAWAKFAPEAARNPGRLQEMVEALSISFKKVNQDVVLTSISRLETDPVFAGKAEIAPKAKQTSKGNALQNFLADLVLDSDSTQHDTLSSEARLLSLFSKNKAAVAKLMKQPYFISVNDVPPLQASMVKHAVLKLSVLFGYKETDFEGMGVFLNGPGLDARINEKLDEFKARLDRGESVPELAAFDKSIQEFVDDRSEKLQNVMAKTFESMMSDQGCEMGKLLSEVDPESKAMLDKMNPLKKEQPVVEEKQAEGEKAELPDHLPKGFDGDVMSENDMKRYLGKTGTVNGKSKPYAAMTSQEWEQATHDLTAADRCEAVLAVWVEKYANNDVLGAVMARVTANEESIQANFNGDFGYDDLILNAPAGEAKNSFKAKLSPSLTLDQIVSKGALDPKQGYGKFIVNSMKTYFKSVDAIDKRAMYAALIRNAPTTTEFLNQPKGNAPGKDDEFMGATLGAYFKGAGPVMQKTLQLLSSMDLPKAFKAALVDMRSNLLPLPDKVVQAMLAKLVEDSHGEITHIVAKETLGAASVAQSILCEITRPNGETREVVVKLVRPDAAYRADREKRVFLEAAGGDEGMRSSFLGRLERIMEEFDLEIEASNAELGKVYDKSGKLYEHTNSLIISDQSEKFSDVKAVKIDSTNPKGSHFAVIMEKAPGTTLDRTIKSAAERIKESIEDFHKQKTVEGKKNFLLKKGDELLGLNEKLMSAKNKMVHFAHQWVNEALYGGGFFHGDAHAGNLMVDGQKLTAIDFGNATKLTPHDQKMVLRVIGSCQSKDVDMFVQSFGEMLSEAGKRSFESQKGELKKRVQSLMNKMTSNGQVGTLIMATLIELQKMEIEIPAPIFNFSQCQMLIEGTIKQMDAQLNELHEHLKALKHAASVNSGEIADMSDTDLGLKLGSVNDLLNPNPQEPVEDYGLSAIRKLFNTEFGVFDNRIREDFDGLEKRLPNLLGNGTRSACRDLMNNETYVKMKNYITYSKPLAHLLSEPYKKAVRELKGAGWLKEPVTRAGLENALKQVDEAQNNLVKNLNLDPDSKQAEAKRLEGLVDALKPIVSLPSEIQDLDEASIARFLEDHDLPQITDDQFKSELKPTFEKLVKEFKDQVEQGRKADLQDYQKLLEAERKRRKNKKFDERNASPDEIMRRKIASVVDEKNFSKKTAWQNDRSFLSVMADDLAEHKWKTAQSLGFMGSFKFLSKMI